MSSAKLVDFCALLMACHIVLVFGPDGALCGGYMSLQHMSLLLHHSFMYFSNIVACFPLEFAISVVSCSVFKCIFFVIQSSGVVKASSMSVQYM